MSRNAAEGGVGSDGLNVEEPHVGRMISFLFLTHFAGLFVILPFRDYFIMRHNLTFPSGTATAHLINTIHTPHGAKQASKQVSALLKTFLVTMAWSVFQWFFAGGGGATCGFHAFPTFGLAALRRGFSFNFAMSNVGVGMLSPYKITVSMLAGSLVAWGLLWPYIERKEGSWYPAGLGEYSLSGINAYRTFIGISMVLADGLFHLLCILLRTLHAMYAARRQRRQPFRCISSGCVDDSRPIPAARSFDDRRRAQVFIRDRVSAPAAALGYVALAAVSVGVIPRLYPQLRHVHVAAAYLAAPAFAFSNTYGNGLTDMHVAAMYGKIAILVFGAWAGLANGGVVTGLAACGLLVSTVSPAADLVQEMRTGYLTLTSPHTVLVAQLAGTALGCVVSPVVFWALYKLYADEVDGPDTVPYAKLYRAMAMLGTGQGGGLPRHSVLLCEAFFALALAMGVLREVAARRRWRAVGRYLPSTIALAVGFFVSPKLSIGMCVGSVVMWLWKRHDRDEARLLAPAVAAGMICGDGFGSLLLSVLAIFKARAPICIMFLSREVNARLDVFLATLHNS